MRMNNQTNIMNIGIPNYNPIDLSVFDLTLSCAKNKSILISREREIRNELKKEIENLTGVSTVGKIYPFSEISFQTNPSNSISDLKIDSFNNIQSLMYCIYEMNRVIDSNNYNNLNKSLRGLREVLNFVNRYPYTHDVFEYLEKKYPRIRQEVKGNDLRTYLNLKMNYLDIIMEDIPKLDDLDLSNYVEYYKEELDEEKLGLFIAKSYLETINRNKRILSREDIQKHLFYISSYLKDKTNKNTSIDMYYGPKITYYDLLSAYNNLLKSNKDLKDLSFERSHFINKSKEENDIVINNLINLESIKIPGTFIKPGKRYQSNNNQDEKEIKEVSLEEKERIQKAIEEKYLTYMKYNPIAQIEGTGSFSKYIAFVLENGIIPSDRFLHINNINQLKEDAAYIFDANNFESDVIKDKQQLIGKTPRVIHKGNWESRIEEYASKETSEELKTKAKTLVKRLK